MYPGYKKGINLSPFLIIVQINSYTFPIYENCFKLYAGRDCSEITTLKKAKLFSLAAFFPQNYLKTSILISPECRIIFRVSVFELCKTHANFLKIFSESNFPANK